MSEGNYYSFFFHGPWCSVECSVRVPTFLHDSKGVFDSKWHLVTNGSFINMCSKLSSIVGALKRFVYFRYRGVYHRCLHAQCVTLHDFGHGGVQCLHDMGYCMGWDMGDASSGNA
jgi:hypothetical protein